MDANEPPALTRPPPRTSPVVRAIRAALWGVRRAGPKTKPTYQRWWFRGTASLAVLLIFGAANNFGDPSTTASSASRRSGAGLGGAALAQAAPAAAPAKPTDQGFVLVSYRFKDSASGDLGGWVRVTNTNDTAESAVFTIFLRIKGHPVITFQGSADSAAAGKTISVQVASHVKYKPAAYLIDFQTAVTKYYPRAAFAPNPPGARPKMVEADGVFSLTDL